MHTLATPFANRQIVLCVAGGIAAYKSVYLLRSLVREDASVRVAMTRSAQEFVGALTFQSLSGQPVFTDLFDNQQDADIGHIRVADGADLLIVAPATANLLARMVAGMANDPVSAAILAARCPVLVAPAMNVNMWEDPATRANVETLVERGFLFVGPDDGFLACKWTGSGRLSEPEDILEAAAQALVPKDLEGQRFVIAAGGTREAIDPVRFLGNRSTGKMGYALALAAARRGASVQLIAGPNNLPNRTGAELISVQSAREMHEAVMAASESADVVIMAAAVADYRPVSLSEEKLKKESWGEAPSIELERTTDILATLGSNRKEGGPYLVGFAAETQEVGKAARKKLEEKGCDLIVANDVGRDDSGFGSEDNAVELIWKGDSRQIALASKESIAHSILDHVLLDRSGS
jgi:phosphopantothenoylcysteine decarboxylase/phosphopantothenate--cysteine ligase